LKAKKRLLTGLVSYLDVVGSDHSFLRAVISECFLIKTPIKRNKGQFLAESRYLAS
jgi:hypothetical protein